MKVILLITVVVLLSMVSGNDKPCQKNSKRYAYRKFASMHFVEDDFERTSKDEWEEYIERKELCDRPPNSFFEKSDEDGVIDVCNGHGRPLKNGAQGNLCMSDATMHVYDVIVDEKCKVKSLKENNIKVILACDVVEDECRPVQYEKNDGQQADMKANPCKP